MNRKAAGRLGKRAADRLRSIRRKAAEWQRRARRAATLALITAGAAVVPSFAAAQMGQMAMAPAGGIVNRAMGGFQSLSMNGPGYLYYGLNAADRGLGYNGSYMTLGGYIPYSEDSLGGLWAADLRSHLSVNGGFFSNVGVVRKQFLGGSLLGVGVFWDYDGDGNQYPVEGACGAEYGQFGHTYNQVGVSGEWLTDFGNLRSNGYMPVGTTAYTAGAPGSPFYKNYVMCQYGLDAALSGADLEVGAYVPGLSDWAGMISVGGYALGNSRYNWWSGPLTGQDVVPWFGGVYTRLDMTFLENWDFSLQTNNDSYFDWTGFARLTYRMGGSRRRNVPDQMEQPMMRNEHIVRAHQTPIMATNTGNGARPWRVIHVDNAAPAGGDGSAERPFNTLAAANAAAMNPWDIVFVERGDGTAAGYGTPFTFRADNQFLVGNGAPFLLESGCCGLINIATDVSGSRPVLTNPSGASVIIDGAVAGGAVVSNFDIIGSRTGIYGTGNLSSGVSRPGPAGPITYASATGDTVVTNVTITSTGPGESGVVLNGGTLPVPGAPASTLDGGITFFDTAISGATDYGIAVGGPSTADFRMTYNGSVQTANAENIILVAGMTGGEINVAVGNAPAGSTVPNQVTATGGGGIAIDANSADTAITVDNVTLTNTVGNAIDVIDDEAVTLITAGAGSGISRAAAGAAVNVSGGAPRFTYEGPINNARGGPGGAPSHLLSVLDVGATANINLLSPRGMPFTDTGDGILIQGVADGGQVSVIGARITSSGGYGILASNSSGALRFGEITIDSATNAAVALLANRINLDVTFSQLNIAMASNTTAYGLVSSSLGVENYSVTVAGAGNTIATGATTLPAVSMEATTFGVPSIAMQFNSVVSGVPAGGNDALVFGGSATGTFATTSFLVNGGTTQGTVAADVTPGGVTVIVPP